MGSRYQALAALLLVVVMLASTVSYALPMPGASPTPVPSTQSLPTAKDSWKNKVDPYLLTEDAYNRETLLPLPDNIVAPLDTVKSLVATKLPSPIDGKARIVVFFQGGEEAINAIKNVVTVASGVKFENANSGMLIAWADKSQVEELAMLPYVTYISADRQMPVPSVRSDLSFETTEFTGGFEPNIYGAVEIMGATYAWSLGYNGSGVKVAVVDTGIDMGETDLGEEALARDAFGRPLLFDADEVGLVLTINPTYYDEANSTITVLPYGSYNGVIFYDGYDGGLYLIDSMLVYVADLYSGTFTYYMEPVLNQTFKVPGEITANSTVYFGLISQNLYVGSFFVWYLVPTIMVDYNGDGVFDAAYADLSTVYYYFLLALYDLGYMASPPDPALLDFSFADETPFNYTHPIVARDFTGDGVNDFSLGAVAGAFNDANSVFAANYTFDWLNDWENTGYILPGFHSGGVFYDLVFDFHSHGTYCAHVIAGRGKVPRPLGYGDIYYNLTGVAPGAKIGGAPALWNGNVIIAELYLSGYYLLDPANFTWTYTGWTQADVISNSWGSSYLLYNGYASDADPTSIYEDFITLTTGTVIVHAAGNGGPGFGSVTMPGAATAVITVGASTEFYYRPVYGYLPGGYGQVVSWSDRGPTQFAYPKPDVVNIGSFAWSVGRVIDGLGNGVYAFDLFGGTSEATPMTAGAVAILIQALRDNGYPTPPALVKTILKSSAKDLGYDPFSQGSGHVDLVNAINTILGSGLIAMSDAPLQVSQYYISTMAAITGYDYTTLYSLWSNYADTALYFGVVKPGESSTTSLAVYGVDNPENLTIKTVQLVKDSSYKLYSIMNSDMAVLYVPGEGFLPLPNKYVAVVGDYIFVRASQLPPGARLLIPVQENAFNGDLTEINVYYPYRYFDPYGRAGDYNYYNFYMGVELSYWIDYNNYGIPVPWETARMQYDIRAGNAFHVQLGNPAEAFNITKTTALQYLQEYYGINASGSLMMPVLDIRFFINSYYGANTNIVIPLKVEFINYKYEDWSWISAEYSPLTGTVNVTATVPTDAKPGVYEGYLRLCYNGQKVNVPLTIAVPFVVEPGRTVIGYGQEQGLFYDNYVYKGALDQSWRPEVGDWRVFPIVLDNDNGRIIGLQVRVSWGSTQTSFDIGLIGPGYNFWGVGDINYTTWIDAAVVGAKLSGLSRFVGANGVFTYFDWPSQRSAQILAPVASTLIDPQASTYWLVVHQVFTGYGKDRPLITISPVTVYNNMVYMNSDSVKIKVTTIWSQQMGSATLSDPIVIPLSGGSPEDLTVTIFNPSLSPLTVKRVLVAFNASSTASGYYLVLVPITGSYPSIIWGYSVQGTTGVLVYMPYMSYMYYIVYVAP